jgi:hypothetical protein
MDSELKIAGKNSVETYKQGNLLRNIALGTALGVVLASGYGISRNTDEISNFVHNTTGFVEYLGDSLADTTHPSNIFNNSDKKIVEHNVVLPKLAYNLCTEEQNMSVNNFNVSDLENKLEGIQNSFFNESSTCTPTNNWYDNSLVAVNNLENTGVIDVKTKNGLISKINEVNYLSL